MATKNEAQKAEAKEAEAAEEAANLRLLNTYLEEEPFKFTKENLLLLIDRGVPTIDDPEPEEPEEPEEPNIPIPYNDEMSNAGSEPDEPGDPDVEFRF